MKAVQRKTTADTPVLDEMVRRIAAGFNPQRIILFGSHARWDSTEDSDYDLFGHCAIDRTAMVTLGSERRGADGSSTKYIVWWTEEEIAEWQAVRNHFVNSAISEGRVVYEATA